MSGDKKEPRSTIFDIDKEKNFPDWFGEICKVAELADIRYGVKGFTPFPPWSLMTMNNMFDILEDVLQRKDHLPMLFPTVIPESNLTKEAQHVDGFVPQVFWIEETGEGTKLEERLALRPTSETAIYPMYSLWVRSWRDLPMKLYQRCSVFRSEVKSTRPFLRGREFLWIESHNVYSSHDEVKAQVKEDLETTQEVVTENFGIPVMVFRRTQWDKFPGGLNTYAADTLMPDGKVIQLPSTHDLGDNFSRAFDIKYLNENNETVHAWQTCYGPAISRIFGALISVHGDNKGLRLPFKIAPYQVVIVPIYKGENEKIVLDYCRSIKNTLKRGHLRVYLDNNDNTPGKKYNYWEMKGVPIRIEIGPRDINNGTITIFRRDTLEKETVYLDELRNLSNRRRDDSYLENQGNRRFRNQPPGFITGLIKWVKKYGKDIDKNLREAAESKFDGLVVDADSFGTIEDALDKGKIARIPFCTTEMEGLPCDEEIKDRTGGEVRGTRIDVEDKPEGVCVACGKVATEIVYIARSY